MYQVLTSLAAIETISDMSVDFRCRHLLGLVVKFIMHLNESLHCHSNTARYCFVTNNVVTRTHSSSMRTTHLPTLSALATRCQYQ